MAKEPIISVSGLRGIIGESLTPVVAANYIAAFASEFADGPVVVSRDGRATGPMLSDAIKSTLNAMGRDVIYANVASTPTTGILVRSAKAAGGVQISASHNPPEYNGIKLFGSDGRVIGAEAGQRVLDRYRRGDATWKSHDAIGSSSSCDDSIREHMRLVLETVDVELIKSNRFKVLLDSNHGAGSLLGRPLLESLGCEVTVLGEDPHGQFAHTPEPTAENLASVREQVVKAGAQVGFCQDPDADRLALIDESGRYVGEEYTLAIVLNHVLAKQSGPIVTNCSTSRMSQDLAEKYNVPFLRSKVGEANVCDVMQASHAVFGGEGNGGPIDPRVGYVRDSFVGMANVLAAMAIRKLPLSRLADELPRYEIYKSKVTLDADSVPAFLDRLEKHFSDANSDRMDGLRLDWEKKWLLVRASNTEPIVRLVAEASLFDDAKSLCDQAAALNT